MFVVICKCEEKCDMLFYIFLVYVVILLLLMFVGGFVLGCI